MDLPAALLCLALNVYFEARGEPETGQYAVAHVTLNRARSNKTTVCQEVHKPNQFSWTRTRYRVPHKDDESWKKAIRIAREAHQIDDPTRGSLYFFNPKKCKNTKTITTGRVRQTKIGSHVFYADKGKTK